MLRNYLIVAVRNLIRGKLYTFINVLGLSVGVASCAMIALVVHHTWSYDEWHEQRDSIYQVLLREVSPEGKVQLKGHQPVDVVPAIKDDMPEIERATRVISSQVIVSYADARFKQRVLFADPDVMRMFTYPLHSGDAATCLTDLSSAVLSEQTFDDCSGVRAKRSRV